MRNVVLAFSAGLLLLTGCATKTVTPNVIQVDMSATRMVSGKQKPMTAEVVFIRDLASNREKYRYEIGNRRSLGIESYAQVLPPGYYEIVTVCAERNFYNRMAGLLSVDKHDNGSLWARFQTGQGTSALMPAMVMNLELTGTEKIVPLNISAVGGPYCEAVYGEGVLNQPPANEASNNDYISKHGKKTKFYSYW